LAEATIRNSIVLEDAVRDSVAAICPTLQQQVLACPRRDANHRPHDRCRQIEYQRGWWCAEILRETSNTLSYGGPDIGASTCRLFVALTNLRHAFSARENW